MSVSSSVHRSDYWNRAVLESGPRSLDKELSEHSNWNDVLATGEADLAEALKSTVVTFGAERSALEIGCGAGRMSHAFGLRFQRVLGVDIAVQMVEMANTHRQLDNISFALANEQTIVPPSAGTFDTIFSYEVFHYLPSTVLNHYLKVAHSLLNPGGELVFQLNVVPITPLTWLSLQFRSFMFALGIERWRGWSNNPAFQRHCHSPAAVIAELKKIGFQCDSPRGRPRQTWFRAVRPN